MVAPNYVGLFIIFNYFLIGIQLPYDIVLVSVVQQSESAICIHIFPSSLDLFSI